MASIRRLGPDRWQITWYVGAYIDENGKRRERKASRIVRGSYAEAKRVAASIEKERPNAPLSPTDPAQRTFGRLAAEWLNQRRADVGRGTLEPATWRRYEETLRLYALPLLADIPVARLEPYQIEAAYQAAPPGSARYLHAAVRQILREALRNRFILWDIGAVVRAPKYRRTKRQPVPMEDAGKILAAFADTPHFALVATMYAMGLRMGELLALKWEDVDWQNGVVWMRGALKKSGNAPVFGSRKNDEAYPIAVSQDVLEVLDKHRADQLMQKARWKEDWGLIFTASDGSPLNAENWRKRVWHPTLRALGIPRYVPHQMRHAFVTEGLGGEDPIGLATVAAAIGDDPSTVAAHYADAITPDKRRLAEKAGRLLRTAIDLGERWRKEREGRA